jgi:hypothetical protein
MQIAAKTARLLEEALDGEAQKEGAHPENGGAQTEGAHPSITGPALTERGAIERLVAVFGDCPDPHRLGENATWGGFLSVSDPGVWGCVEEALAASKNGKDKGVQGWDEVLCHVLRVQTGLNKTLRPKPGSRNTRDGTLFPWTRNSLGLGNIRFDPVPDTLNPKPEIRDPTPDSRNSKP